jgi:DNA-directed RNA polymerase subunit H (RpoH/RPB5)
MADAADETRVTSVSAPKLLLFVTRVVPGAADMVKIDAWITPGVDVQVFTLEELQFNKTRHFLVPKHELMDDPVAIAQLLERFKLKAATQLPLMLQSDAICKYFNGKPGNVMRIERVSPSSGIAIVYRCIVQK